MTGRSQPIEVTKIRGDLRESADDRVAVEEPLEIRLGYEDSQPLLDVVTGICAAGADELVIHARTKQQGYRPPAHWQLIHLAREAADIPVIANGEVWSLDDARRCRELSGCPDLMLGRGALYRPDLPRLIAAEHRDQTLYPLAWPAIPPLLQQFFRSNLEYYDARHAGNPVKQWLVYLRHYFPQAALLFEQIKRLHDPDDVASVLQQELRRTEGQQSAA